MYCKNCGTENDNDAKFCKSCGAELDNINDAYLNKKCDNENFNRDGNSDNLTDSDNSFKENSDHNNRLAVIIAVIAVVIISAFVFFNKRGNAALYEKEADEFAVKMENQDFEGLINNMKWPDGIFGSDETKLNYLKYLYNSDFAGAVKEKTERNENEKNMFILYMKGKNGIKEIPFKVYKGKKGSSEIELLDLKEGSVNILAPTESHVYIDGEEIFAEEESKEFLAYSIFTTQGLLYGEHNLKITIPTFQDYEKSFNLNEEFKSFDYLDPKVTEETKKEIEQIGYEVARNWEYCACWNKPFEDVSSHFYSDPEYSKDIKRKYDELVQFFEQDDPYMPFSYNVFKVTDCRMTRFYYDTSFPLYIGMYFDVDYYAEGAYKVESGGFRNSDRFNITDDIHVVCTYVDGKWVISDIEDSNREDMISLLKQDRAKGEWIDYGNFRKVFK